MKFKQIEVYDENTPVGELKAHSSTYFTFEYFKDWNSDSPNAFALDSQLPLEQSAKTQYTSNNLWGCFADLLPDRWGRKLQSRYAGRMLDDIDYMLGVSDFYRIGSLRLKVNNEFVAKDNHTPNIIHINEILESSLNVEKEAYTYKDLAHLLGCGSSLGGARPKACLIDNNHKLYIAKFPSNNDEYSIILWEKTMLDLAQIAGIEVPNSRLIETKFNKIALLIERFDRIDDKRVPFKSAMSLLNVSEKAGADEKSYIDIAQNLHASDKQKLFRRMVFNALFGNTDDHLRNHALLYDRKSKQWNLAPAFDLNPNPLPYQKQTHALKFTTHSDKPSIELCIEIAKDFEVSQNLCVNIVRDCYNAGLQYQNIASKNGIKSAEIKFMAGNFSHKDMDFIAHSRAIMQDKDFKNIEINKAKQPKPKRKTR